MSQIVLTSSMESLEDSPTGGVKLLSVLIASMTGDASSPRFGTVWKCTMKNRQNGTNSTDCASHLRSVRTDGGLNITYYGRKSGNATCFKSRDYLEIQI